jgi:hypothetical protein
MMPNQRMDFGKMASITRWMAPDGRPQHIPEMLEGFVEKAA